MVGVPELVRCETFRPLPSVHRVVSVIGVRGAGKTNISRRIGLAVKRPVLSTDVLVSYEHGGASISQLVARHGWPWFREQEARVLNKAARIDGTVLDCGGGILVDTSPDGAETLNSAKLAILRDTTTVVWLRGDLERLARKVASDPKRPELTDPANLIAVMKAREAMYSEAAHVAVSIEGLSRPELAEAVLSALGWSSE